MILDPTTTYSVGVSVTGIDLLALKKLSLVSHALAQKIGGRAGQEQTALVGVLDGLVRQIELRAVG